jgi:hypothetical protein
MNKTLRHTYLTEKTIHGLLSLFAVLSALYVIVMISIVFSVIERKQDLLAVTTIGNDLMQVENEYAQMVSTLDDTTLKEKGFHKFESTRFAVRKDPIATYALLYAR